MHILWEIGGPDSIYYYQYDYSGTQLLSRFAVRTLKSEIVLDAPGRCTPTSRCRRSHHAVGFIS